MKKPAQLYPDGLFLSADNGELSRKTIWFYPASDILYLKAFYPCFDLDDFVPSSPEDVFRAPEFVVSARGREGNGD